VREMHSIILIYIWPMDALRLM
ncbi:hypothetical protein LSH36_119g13019, partial [Paralvinella palmiformis]